VSSPSNSPADYWNQRAVEYGHDLKTLAYGSKQTQQRKFDVLISGMKGRRVRVLDVGCGFGDLYFHMTDRGYDVDYSGVDISERIVELARQAHPELRITSGDLLHDDLFPGEQFEYVVSTGINCAVHGRNLELEREMLTSMFARCTKGVAMGLQSAIYLHRNPEANSDNRAWFSDPAGLCEFALKTVTPWATLRHDYMPHDFTLFLFREPCYA
jgi:cyclopropane fatty-acyl-phospholipid synthase-like methyltransferase